MPRVVHSIDELHAECERQRAAIAAGNMRRLGGPGFYGVSVEWEQHDGHWYWRGNGNYHGGLWRSVEDRERAWARAVQEWREHG